MRLIDEIRTGLPLCLTAAYVPPGTWIAFTDHLREALDSAEVILADNVDQFFYSTHPEIRERDESGSDETIRCDNLSDEYPSAVPPFPCVWIEWTPSVPIWRTAARRFGALVNSRRNGDVWEMEIIGVCRPVSQRIGVVSPHARRVVADLTGVVLEAPTASLNLDELVHKPGADDISTLWLHVPMLTLCFLNCRNVHVDWIAPPPAWKKSFQKKHGKPPSRRTGTIIITPMTRLISAALAEHPNATPAERKRIAAHKCRAHIKTYTEVGNFGYSQVRRRSAPSKLRPPI